MNVHMEQLNLIVTWFWVVLGFGTGAVFGLCFQRADWLGGYDSFKRRLYRLGHISFFGLGAINLMFYLTVHSLAGLGATDSLPVRLASWCLVVGAVTMPVCCFVLAHRAHWPAALVFTVPVASLLAGGALTLWQIILL
jgi:hypothetical protein